MEAIFLDVRGGQDRMIEPCDTVEFADAGVERFYTAKRPPQSYEIIVNGRPRTVTGNTVLVGSSFKEGSQPLEQNNTKGMSLSHSEIYRLVQG